MIEIVVEKLPKRKEYIVVNPKG